MTITGDRANSSPLIEKIRARRDELARKLERRPQASGHDGIAAALATLDLLLDGDLSHPSDMVSRDLAIWLETNKHLGIHAEPPADAPPPPVNPNDGKAERYDADPAMAEPNDSHQN